MRLEKSVERDAQGDFTLIRVKEQIVVGNRQELRVLVCDCLDKGAERIKLEMSECPYADSSGLGLIVALSRKSARSKHPIDDHWLPWSFCLVNLVPDIQALFELTCLDGLVQIERLESVV